MKRNDFILIGIILAIACVFFIVVHKKKVSSDASWVVVTASGNQVGRYPLEEDAVYNIQTQDGGTNRLEIKDGVATVTTANCSDKICVHQKGISLNGEMIICLPHEVIIVVESAHSNTNDAVSN